MSNKKEGYRNLGSITYQFRINSEGIQSATEVRLIADPAEAMAVLDALSECLKRTIHSVAKTAVDSMDEKIDDVIKKLNIPELVDKSAEEEVVVEEVGLNSKRHGNA